jgi:ABC-type Zn uptake system ZnuABC Zn-binding protein ZnuA
MTIGRRMTRRGFLLAVSAGTATTLLGACGVGMAPTSAPTTAPVVSPTGAATTAAARAATTAAAASTTVPATSTVTSTATVAAPPVVSASPVAVATRAASAVAATPARQIAVAATTTHIQDFLKNVGGDRLVVSGILKPNVDPHDYETSVQDVQTISRAEIIFVYGVGLDAFMDKAIANANSKAPVITATRGITPLAGDDEEPDGDPHMWFDPTLAQKMVTNIGEALAQFDPPAAATYRRNVQAYNAQIAGMDARVQGIYDQIPAADRKLVTNHNAFRYLADHFGLNVVGAVIPSISDAAEPTAQEINDLIETIRAQKVKAIFAESSANPRVAQQVARETGIAIVDTLYGDTLGEPGSDGDTYIKMMVADATTIVTALK